MGIRDEDIELINKCKDCDSPYICLNNGKPYFTNDEIRKGLKKPFEKYLKLDKLGRCRGAFAYINENSLKISAKEPRKNINPTAWKSIKCENIKDGGYLYNRCHLIGRNLSTKRANRKGLITGTRNFNMNGMLKFEEKVIEYIENNKDQCVLYRVTPYFKGDNLLAEGAEMEAYSIRDNGKGLSYNVFVYNKQEASCII